MAWDVFGRGFAGRLAIEKLVLHLSVGFPSSWSFSREVAIADAALGMNIRGLSVQCH